ncbi:hypothetical protein [Tenacibaculum amylolyticum]|uniref:hypothetical protein n=1 Tax=Tenacibaculum amylolyticum TaxID=104269 RepID=UPI0038965121
MDTHFDMTDAKFENQFQNCTLNPQLFSHEAHLRLAWIHIKKYGVTIAEQNIQNQLQDFVKHVGATDKYHTTLTIAAIRMVNHYIQQSKAKDFQEFIKEFPELNNSFKALINSHYSYDIFSSEEAKSVFLEPDKVPF